MRPQPIASLIASPLAKLPGVDGVSSVSVVETLPTTIGRTFGGTSADYIYFDDPTIYGTAVAFAGQVTIVAWVNPSGTGKRCLFGAGIDSTSSGVDFGVNASGQVYAGGRSQAADTFQEVAGATTLSNGTWYHLAAVIDYASDTISLYVDGVLDNSGSETVTFGVSAFALGSPTSKAKIGANNVNTVHFAGSAADLAVFPRELSTDELAELVAGGRPDNITGNEPVLYWPLDGATDGGGAFAHPRCGGTQGYSVGNVTIASSGPTLSSHKEKEAWRRFDRSLRVMRLRGSDFAAVGDGNAISASEMVGSGATLTSSAFPTFKESNNSLSFNGTTQFLELSTGAFDARRGVTVIALASVASGSRIVSAAGGASDTVNSFAMSPAAWVIDNSFATFTDYTAGSSGLAMFASRWSGVEGKAWLNAVNRNGTVSGATEISDGAFRQTGHINGPTTSKLQIGRRAVGTSLITAMDLIDLIIIEGAVSDEEVRFFEGLLAHEHSQTALLPSGHPYKTTAPTATSAIDYPWGNALIARSYRPADRYLGSPSICKTSANRIFAAHDTFGDTFGGEESVRLWRKVNSDWYGQSEIPNALWHTVWEHTDGNLYMVSVSERRGDLQIHKSTDGGFNWSKTTLSNGTLLTAGNPAGTGYHRGGGLKPLYHDGYIFFAFETYDGSFASGFDSGVLYIPDNGDLMNASEWTATSLLSIGATGLSNRTEPSATPGFLEGNIVVDAADAIYVVLRIVSATMDKAVFIPMSWDGSALSYPTWSSGFIKDFPGGQCKFELVKSGSTFYAIANPDTTDAAGGTTSTNDQDVRNRVSVVSMSAADLSAPSASESQNVIDEDDVKTTTGLSAADSISYHGFNYPSLVVDGSTAKVAYRVSWSGAEAYHDSNFFGYGEIALA